MKSKLTWPILIFLLFQGIALGTEASAEAFWKSVRERRSAFVVKVVQPGSVSYFAVPIDSKRLRLGYVLGVGRKYDSLEELVAEANKTSGKRVSLFLGTADFVVDNLDGYKLGTFTCEEKKILGIK